MSDEVHVIDVLRPCVENATYDIRDNGFIDEESSYIDYYLEDNEEHRSIRCLCGKEFEKLEDAFEHLRDMNQRTGEE